MKSLVLGFAICLVAFSVFAQKAYERNRVFDVLHYVIRTDVNQSNRSINGETEITLRLIDKNARKLQFDAKELRFSGVISDGRTLKYSVQKEFIEVELPVDFDTSGEIRIILKYSATPRKGISFQNEERDGKLVIHSAQVWTHNEPDLARYWFPSFDFPSDKATSEQFITVDSGYDVIANGVLKDTTTISADRTRWHFFMEQPHSTYLVSFVIGKYKRTTEMYRDIPITKNLYNSTNDTISQQFTHTYDAMKLFERITGVDYPFAKYEQTLVSGFNFGGMENITATTLSDRDVSFGNFEFGKGILRDLLVHELAHSWFGNLITCENWAELWLNEGFATYFEAIYAEEQLGDADLRQKVYGDAVTYFAMAARGKDHPLYNTGVNLKSDIFDEVAYQKGGAVLHTLRREIGDAAFFKGVSIYLNENKFGTVTTAKLRSAMERAAKRDLSLFFDQWVFNSGFPKVQINYSHDARTKTLNIRYKQNHFYGANTRVYQLSVPIFFSNGTQTATKILEINKASGDITFPFEFKPRHVVVDPDLKLPLLRYTTNQR